MGRDDPQFPCILRIFLADYYISGQLVWGNVSTNISNDHEVGIEYAEYVVLCTTVVDAKIGGIEFITCGVHWPRPGSHGMSWRLGDFLEMMSMTSRLWGISILSHLRFRTTRRIMKSIRSSCGIFLRPLNRMALVALRIFRFNVYPKRILVSVWEGVRKGVVLHGIRVYPVLSEPCTSYTL